MDSFYIKLIIGIVIFAIVFGILWRKGQLLRLSNFVQETKEELRKCTWPTWDELRGSTALVMVSILVLGAYTVGVDLIIALFVRSII